MRKGYLGVGWSDCPLINCMFAAGSAATPFKRNRVGSDLKLGHASICPYQCSMIRTMHIFKCFLHLRVIFKVEGG